MTAILRDDRGYATIVGAFAVAALAATVIAFLYIGGAVTARHRAQSAADLAALAAAADHVRAAPNPCDTARRLVAAQQTGARLQQCTVEDIDVLVSVAVRIHLGPFGIRDATAQARAGPVAGSG